MVETTQHVRATVASGPGGPCLSNHVMLRNAQEKAARSNGWSDQNAPPSTMGRVQKAGHQERPDRRDDPIAGRPIDSVVD